MNNFSEPVAPQFAWYQAGGWTTLEQGDLLPDCPVVIPSADLSALLSGTVGGGECSDCFRSARRDARK